ncbi:MAG: ribosome-associated translation inhibitor RaiA [Candidatus Saccharibacteria bacterium]|jgi:putative sigma-54 modulation protein|nr:MAG: ribosome-associated translation inhibitor RaiA [Candidatus Saccharibacteria bacterium]
MIEAITITGIKYDLDDTTKKYVTKKIGRLDRYLPKHARKSVTADVRLKEVNKDHGNKYEAEVVLTVPGGVVEASDSTVNMLAAVDIVEMKLMTQLRKYKQATMPHVGSRGVLSRFKRSYARES